MAKPPAAGRMIARRLVAVFVVLLATLLCLLAWLGGSESGLRLIAAGAERITADRLRIEAPGGRLLGDWHAKSLHWRDERQEFELRNLTVNWSPAALPGGELRFERIEAESLRIFQSPDNTPVTPPASLRLPLAIRIAHLRLGEVRLGPADETALPLASGIEATLASDGDRHRLEQGKARLGQLEVAVDASLDGKQPFALTAQATLTGSVIDRPVVVTLLAEGSLERLRIDGKAAASTKPGAAPSAEADSGGTTVAGTLEAVLTPFAPLPLESLHLRTRDLDPAALVAGAPSALLDIDARLASTPAAEPGSAGSAEASVIGGRVHVTNRRDGGLDRQQLPLRSLRANLDWRPRYLALEALNAELAGDGRLAGRGRLADGKLELDLTGQHIDARSLHGQLPPTRLAGPLRARLDGARQWLEIDLRDERHTLSAQASLTPESVELADLRLTAGDARLTGQGRLALSGVGGFDVRGELANFDPARFWQAAQTPVRTLINADFALRGALRPTHEIALRFDLRDSRLGTQALSGHGTLDLLGDRLRKIDLDLQAADNRLTALGGFGARGDKLHLSLQAPRLATLGLAKLTGDARASIDIAGDLTMPQFSGELRATRLHLAEWLDLRELAFAGQLGAGRSGTLTGALSCASCASAAFGVPPLAIQASLDGLRDKHRFAARVGLPEQREIALTLEGGLNATSPNPTPATPAMTWRGALVALRAGSGLPEETPPWLELSAPAPLHVGTGSLAFGPARGKGRIGELRIERLELAEGRWRSAGQWQGLAPQRLLAEFPSLHAWHELLGQSGPQPLVVSGEWDVVLGDRGAAPAKGRLALWRESGDLLIGKLPLGLSEARLQASLSDGRLALDARLRGKQLGHIDAELTATSMLGSGESHAALIDRQTPWQGHLLASGADLAWLGPLLGDGWQVGGRLDGEMSLAGSAARPVLRGQWRGQQLALRALDLGMRLERGQGLLEITPDRLILRDLGFDSDLQPLPRALALDERIDTAKLTGTPGRFEASGELDLGGTTGSPTRLSVRLDRLGVMQHSDQWIALSGDGELRLNRHLLDIDGKLRIDAGYWSLGPPGKPALSDDVVIRSPASARSATQPSTSRAPTPAIRLDLEAGFGRSFHFVGAGIESRLAGKIRIQSADLALPRATGSIRTVDGRFDAYGQKLAIERGIVNFQGPIDNPGLNLLAVRKNLPVEAGVEVTGSVQRPLIRLVSTPVVPDTEKLSWLVLGQAPDQQSGADSSLLFAAAQTILGGQDGGVLSKLQRGLGIDEFGVGSGQIGGSGSLPTSRVASANGFSGNETMNGQIVSVGKRLSSKALLTYEKSLNSAENIVKLTVNLNRQFSLVGRAGSESALDLFWNSSFGR